MRFRSCIVIYTISFVENELEYLTMNTELTKAHAFWVFEGWGFWCGI